MSRSAPLLVDGDSSVPIRTRAAAAGMMLVAGSTFALVGFADISLLWIPLNRASVAWEYATVGRTLDSLPMPLLGLLLLAYGVLRAPRPTRRGVAFVTMIFTLFGLLTLFMAFLIFTSAPAVISQAGVEAELAVRRAAVRHGVQGILYPFACFAIAVIVWRSRATETP